MAEELKASEMMIGFNALRQENLLLDFTVRVDDREFRAHKQLLAAQSDYFKAMFSHDNIESEEDAVILQDIEPDIMEVVIDFCYTGRVDLTSENETNLLLVASRLQIKTLQEVCCRFIEKSVDNEKCLEILTLADRINLGRLIDVAVEHCCANFAEIVTQPDFLTIGNSVLERIISSDTLQVTNESEVLEAVIRWVEHDESSRRCHFDDLLPLVRFALMSPVDLVGAWSREILQDSPAGIYQIESAKNHQLLINFPEKLQLVKDKINTRPRSSLIGYRGYRKGSSILIIGDFYEDQKIGTNGIWGQVPTLGLEFTTKDCGIAELDGSIYAIGGSNGASRCRRFDLTKAEGWRNDVQPLPIELRKLKAVTFNGSIFALGGLTRGIPSDQVWQYNVRRNIWVSSGSLLEPRYSFAVAMHNGALYIAGGITTNDIRVRSVEKMQPGGAWERFHEMRLSRKDFSLCSFAGKLYAVGGAYDTSAEYFDEEDNKWHLTSEMVHSRHDQTNAIVLGDKLYAIKLNTEPGSIRTFMYAETYDLAAREWVRIEPPLKSCKSVAIL